MTDWLTELEDAGLTRAALADIGDIVVAIVRQVAREEAQQVVLEHNRGETGAAALAKGKAAAAEMTCGARDPNRPQAVCLKPPHAGRHKYTLQAAPPPPRNWKPIEEAQIKSGSRTYAITLGHPVKVQGLGRAGAAGDGYKVVSMERHTETGEVNVEVVKQGKNQRSRVVKLDRIVYKRPKK